jgi:Fe-S-cluster-containing hydrogenase component 2
VAVCAPLALAIVGGELGYDAEACTMCGDCVIACPLEALTAGE